MDALAPLFASPWPWVIAGALLVGLEIVAPGVFLLWIGLGALTVGLVLLGAPELALPWQLLAFALAMPASLAIGFAIQRRSRRSASDDTLNRELDALLGRQAEAVQAFQDGRGRIRVGDSSYPAHCDTPVAAGQTLRIVAHAADGSFTVAALDTARAANGNTPSG